MPRCNTAHSFSDGQPGPSADLGHAQGGCNRSPGHRVKSFNRRSSVPTLARRTDGCPGAANGSDAKLHGQGPRAEARAARGALHVRRANARRVTPRDFDSNEAARPPGRSRAVPASAASWAARLCRTVDYFGATSVAPVVFLPLVQQSHIAVKLCGIAPAPPASCGSVFVIGN